MRQADNIRDKKRMKNRHLVKNRPYQGQTGHMPGKNPSIVNFISNCPEFDSNVLK
jgi:hypothetical protein